MICPLWDLDQEMQILSAGLRRFVWACLSSCWAWSGDADFICWLKKICISRSFIIMSMIQRCVSYLLALEDLTEQVFLHVELNQEMQILSVGLRRFVSACISSWWAWSGDADFICWLKKICQSRSFIVISLTWRCRFYLLA